MNTNNKKAMPIGITNFKKIIDKNCEYIDKTLIIKDILESSAETTLFPRPRRFGKSVTMSMLDNFFDISKKDDNVNLFDNLNISNHPEVMAHMGSYPVIFISLKDVAKPTWKETYENIVNLIARIYKSYSYIYDKLDFFDKNDFDKIALKTGSVSDFETSLLQLSIWLEKYYKKKVVILIDEYDNPLEVSFTKGYYEECKEFFKTLLGSSLKDNNSLEFSVITGIMRISKDSIFSELNHLKVCSLNDKSYNEYFGFTNEEVESLLNKYELTGLIDDVKTWYNGYNFAGRDIYNPWSILNFIDSNGIFEPYWVSTSRNILIADYVSKNDKRILKDLENLLTGSDVISELYKTLTFNEIDYKNKDTLLNFLMNTGYLTVKDYLITENKDINDTVSLKIPNIEVKKVFTDIIASWFRETDSSEHLTNFKNEIFTGDKEKLQLHLDTLLKYNVSYFDAAENFYHGLVLGIISLLGSDYIVDSNKESGTGRSDVKIYKKDYSVGAIFEFKYCDNVESLEQEAIAAIKQIEHKQYQKEFEKLGIRNIYTYGVSFSEKEVVIK